MIFLWNIKSEVNVGTSFGVDKINFSSATDLTIAEHSVDFLETLQKYIGWRVTHVRVTEEAKAKFSKTEIDQVQFSKHDDLTIVANQGPDVFKKYDKWKIVAFENPNGESNLVENQVEFNTAKANLGGDVHVQLILVVSETRVKEKAGFDDAVQAKSSRQSIQLVVVNS